MKKLIYLSLLSLPLFMAACGNKAQGTAESDSTEVTSDSVVVVEEVETPNAVKGELGLFELQGPVKSCKMKNKWGTISRTFDEQGMWQTHEGKALSKIYSGGMKRDEKGRIVEGTMDDGGVDTYEYDAVGCETRYFYQMGNESTEWICTYDADGKLQSKKVTEITFDSDGEPYTETYKVLVTDEHGNWTKREVIVGTVVEDTQSRTITYYE